MKYTNRIKTYYKRNNKIRGAGFDNYREFLASKIWKEVRNILLAKPQSKECYFCGSRSRVDLHHCRYSNIIKSPTQYILPSCRNCHESIHRIEKDLEIPVYEATRIWRDKHKVTRSSEKGLCKKFFNRFWGFK